MGLIGVSTGSYQGSCLGQLQRRGHIESLTDTGNQRLPGKPRLALAAPLPLGRGHEAGALTVEIDTRSLPEPEQRKIIVQLVDAQLLGQRVVVHVAGLDDGFRNIHLAMAPLLPVPVLMVITRKAIPPRIRHRVIGINQGVVQTGKRIDWLYS